MIPSAQLLNILIEYLAKRDIEKLSKEALHKKYGIEKTDLLVLLGNSSLYVAERAAYAYQNGLTKTILISGGKGHSTSFLYENILKHPQYNSIQTNERSEAELFKIILTDFYRISNNVLLIEKVSTNCGANALETYELLKTKNIHPGSILLMQDPVLQRRSEASFQKVFQDRSIQFISYASFIPYLTEEEGQLVYLDKRSEDFCNIERLLSLVMGEIPRLRNDENGYGPKGKNFIVPVEIPSHVLDAYQQLLPVYGNYVRN